MIVSRATKMYHLSAWLYFQDGRSVAGESELFVGYASNTKSKPQDRLNRYIISIHKYPPPGQCSPSSIQPTEDYRQVCTVIVWKGGSAGWVLRNEACLELSAAISLWRIFKRGGERHGARRVALELLEFDNTKTLSRAEVSCRDRIEIFKEP